MEKNNSESKKEKDKGECSVPALIKDDVVSRRCLSGTGYVMIITTVFLFAYPLSRDLFVNPEIPPSPGNEGQFVWFLRYFHLELFAILGGIFLALFGVRLLFASGKDTPRVIPNEDRDLLEPLVRDANKDAIDQYVILSSLSGFTGTFQKIGFSGLPLATVTLTILFCILSFIKPEFIEFAKLTLGAFIGSFVQRERGSDDERLQAKIPQSSDQSK